MKVSIYPHIKEVKKSSEVFIDEVLLGIQSGRWQDLCLKIANEPDKDKRTELKKSVPYFTASGTFEHRSNAAIKEHSGLIAIDFDEVDNVNLYAGLLATDPYTFACFRSISHRGLCVLVKIDPEKHRESFEGLQNYYFNLLKLPIDPACKDLSRPRYVSYDPDLFQAPGSKLFKLYPKKETKKEYLQRAKTDYLHTQTKFDRVLSKIDRDITGDYNQWVRIGFAIASSFGESGLNYFHHISSYSPVYDSAACEKQYKYCCRAKDGITIGTFYYYVKHTGIEITDDREEYVTKLAYYAKTGGRTIGSVPDVMKIAGVEPAPGDGEIIDAVFASKQFIPIKGEGKDGDKLDLDEVELWIKTNYRIKKNEVTRFYELDGKEVEQEQLNTIFISAKKTFDKLSREIFDTIIFSTFTESYNPIKEYITGLKWDGLDRIRALAHSITSETGTLDFRERMLTHWLIGIIESVFTEEPNILCLVLAGKKNTGKTWFFKKLLPKELRPYFASSQMDKGKDDEILMCQKLIIFDDEYSGKSKQDSKKMKMLLSSDFFTLREPYGRKNITLRRIATMCGTCNEVDVLNDLTGNRRIIVFEVTGKFNYSQYNEIDKEQLFAQLYKKFLNGDRCQLTDADISDLESNTGEKFKEASAEDEMIDYLFEKPGHPMSDFMSCTQIKNYIESHTVQRLSLKKLGMELKRLGYQWLGRSGRWGYMIAKKFFQPQNVG